jgi:hypothetical protein
LPLVIGLRGLVRKCVTPRFEHLSRHRCDTYDEPFVRQQPRRRDPASRQPDHHPAPDRSGGGGGIAITAPGMGHAVMIVGRRTRMRGPSSGCGNGSRACRHLLRGSSQMGSAHETPGATVGDTARLLNADAEEVYGRSPTASPSASKNEPRGDFGDGNGPNDDELSQLSRGEAGSIPRQRGTR